MAYLWKASNHNVRLEKNAMNKLFVFTLLLAGMVGAAEAKVTPLVIKSTFTNDTWFPLPIEQMKSAAIDTALTKISSTNKFAFLYASEDNSINSGTLSLAVSLVEPAESAQLTIKLNLPDNKGSFVSSSSVSLSDKNYKRIYNALQDLGYAAAEQLDLSISEIENDEPGDKRVDTIYEEIMSLNINFIKLQKDINANAVTSHNKAIYSRLDKLDTIIDKLDEHHAYVKESNESQNKKLDSIYSELQKLNIGSNTGNSPPDVSKLTPFDIKVLPIVNTAIKLKYKKDFSGSRNILAKVFKNTQISKLFKNVVEEELFINLPLYEADTKKTELSYGFMDQVNGDKYQTTVNHIRTLYETVLARPDVLFEKRADIKQKMDSLMISADSMSAVVKMMRKNELFNLKTMLRVHMQRMMVFGSSGNKGLCPTDKQITTVIRKANMKILKLGSLKQSGEWCNLYLTDDNKNSEHIKFNYDEVIITEKT